MNDMVKAERYILKHIQANNYGMEIQCLKQNKYVNKASKLSSLSVFLDENELLRVGGRLMKSELTYDAKHQILLPSSSIVTKLIIEEIHEQTLHGGPRLTEATIRQRFWITNSQHNIKGILKGCVICARHRGTTFNQKMANLPTVRVRQPERPFTNVSLDYAGPIRIKSGTLRAAKVVKAYIAIFVCMAIKAIHVELVSNMTANAFISALRRFSARRGKPSRIYTDNGTNFVGAATDITEWTEEEAEQFNKEVTNELTKQNISFHFAPAGSPHHNGLAEAAVKSVKFHLKRAMGESILTFEELTTVLYQIEAAVNSRPLCALSSDPNDTTPLTPAHFLIGRSMYAIPGEDYTETNINWLSRWQLVG